METKERKEDRRTKYTRQAIKDTFLALLEKKPFQKSPSRRSVSWLRSTGEPFICTIMIWTMYWMIS